jgi:TRAP-type C4-dicarboxylate transport system permease small subunit
MSQQASAIPPKAWGLPLVKLDQKWTRLEQRLAVWVIVVEIVTLCAWVSLKGLASLYTPDGSAIGLIFRSVFTAILLGLVAHLATRKQQKRTNAIAVCISVMAGLLLGRAWVTIGVDWATNASSWLLNASVPSLVGGPRGVVTRLTLWVALLGASMAASRGKHINIDIATRYLPDKAITPVAIIGWIAAAVVCFAAAFGFVDSIEVTKFRAEAFAPCPSGKAGGEEGALCESSIGARIDKTLEGIRSDLFLLGRQMSLDVRTIPRVLIGEPYDRWMKASEWNAWIKDGGWESHFPKEAVASLIVPADDPNATKMPAVVAPDTGEGRDLLIRDLNFILPFGLMAIGLKFLLRVLRVLSGHVRVDPDAAHDEEDLTHAHDHDREIAETEGSAS